METDVYKLIPEKTQTESIVNYCNRIRHSWELTKEKINLEKFLNLLIIRSGSYADQLEEFIAKKPDSIDSVIKHLLKLYDKSFSEYYDEFKSAVPYDNEPLLRFAQRLKSLYKRSRNDDSPIAGPEERLLVEQFISTLAYDDARLLRICSTPEEMTKLDSIALRASRSVRRPRRVTTLTDEENTEEITDEFSNDFLELILDD